jgi:hypothetical protein
MVTNSQAPDGQTRRGKYVRCGVSVRAGTVRLILERNRNPMEEPMQYALLAYARPDIPDETARLGPIDAAIASVLARPEVTGWIRLHADSSATTVRSTDGEILLTDGPFVDSKEYLAGLIFVEAANLDEALDITRRFQETRSSGVIEVRPILDSLFRAA